MLSKAHFKKAANFIVDNGNRLQVARFHHHFDRPDAATVIDALTDYQNPDGGFGHGLELDLRSEHSSVICTTVACQVLAELAEPVSPKADPCGKQQQMLTRALDYLDASRRGHSWPLVTERNNDAPHAPWWTWQNEAAPGFSPNADAELIALYLRANRDAPGCGTAALLDQAVTYLANHELEQHELLCYLRLFHEPALPEGFRAKLLPYLIQQTFLLVQIDPVDWEEYGLTPVDVVTCPESPLAEFFGDALDSDFNYRIATQGEDGAWSPRWSWGEMFPATWKVVEVEIKAQLTLQLLLKLQRFGYLAH